jgi:chloramphenicol-sensitive protein RarD
VKKGIVYATIAYVLWGIFPVYWKVLDVVPAVQLLGHRIIWSFLLLFSILLAARQVGDLRNRLNRRVLLVYSAAALLIAVNWLTYVWAIGAGYIVETSLGYYINPLLSVLLGVLFLHERLRPVQWLPIGLVAGGVLYLTFVYGAFPWIALTLAISFGLYGLVKKTAPLGALQGMTVETGLLFLPGMAYLLFVQSTGQASFLHSTLRTDLMLMGAGLVTVTPLLLFASAVKDIPLTMVGVLQYINPTISFLLGVLVYREPFDQNRMIGFSIVWAALLFYGFEGLLARKRKTSSPVQLVK